MDKKKKILILVISILFCTGIAVASNQSPENSLFSIFISMYNPANNVSNPNQSTQMTFGSEINNGH